MLNNVKTNNYTNNIPCKNLKNLDKYELQFVINLLNKYNIDFKTYEIEYYIKMYGTSRYKFIKTCKYYSNKDMCASLKYFTKVFGS